MFEHGNWSGPITISRVYTCPLIHYGDNVKKKFTMERIFIFLFFLFWVLQYPCRAYVHVVFGLTKTATTCALPVPRKQHVGTNFTNTTSYSISIHVGCSPFFNFIFCRHPNNPTVLFFSRNQQIFPTRKQRKIRTKQKPHGSHDSFHRLPLPISGRHVLPCNDHRRCSDGVRRPRGLQLPRRSNPQGCRGLRPGLDLR